MGLGVDRLCDGTLTVFGPGFFSVLCGRQTTVFAILLFSFLEPDAPACRQRNPAEKKRTATKGNGHRFATLSRIVCGASTTEIAALLLCSLAKRLGLDRAPPMPSRRTRT